MRQKQDEGKARSGDYEEVALLTRVAAEEMDAFEALYRMYHPRLERFVRGMTKQPGLAEEIIDDTMMVVWRKAYTFNHTAKVSTWIFAIAYRQSLKSLRGIDSTVEFDQDEHGGSTATGPEDELQTLELRRHLDDALQTLSAEQRAVIELTYYFGYGCREIAEIVDCPVDTVKTRMFYARRKLKNVLASHREAI
ncbi:RNA polymerase sigma factor [Dyella sp.]|uniref:RNA polymerase sigma factor n=1 Tax=Dyella sp. TaxID=1869338 RepID=UPI002ED0E417